MEMLNNSKAFTHVLNSSNTLECNPDAGSAALILVSDKSDQSDVVQT